MATQQLKDNLIFFIPFGFLLPMAYCKENWKVWKVTLASFVAIAVVEILEILAGRYMDIDDFIINYIGALIGYFLWNISIKIYQYNKG